MDATLAICACRAGAVGIINGELSTDPQAMRAALETLAQKARAPFGVKLDACGEALRDMLVAYAARGMRWLILDAELLEACGTLINQLRGQGVKLLVEVKTADWNDSALTPWADGLMLKGNEAGGFVGEDSSFILLQKWLPRTRLPLYVRGGMTPHVAAACAAVGVAGGVLDSQLLLMTEARLPVALRVLVGNLSGSETQAVGTGEAGEYFRLLVRPGLTAARQFAAACDSLGYDELRTRVVDNTHWQDAARALLPIGQDVAFAAPWSRRFGTVGAVLRAIDAAVAGHGATAHRCASMAEGAPLALAIKTRFPIIQGPMTRVSDTAEFALTVAAAAQSQFAFEAKPKLVQLSEDPFTNTGAEHKTELEADTYAWKPCSSALLNCSANGLGASACSASLRKNCSMNNLRLQHASRPILRSSRADARIRPCNSSGPACRRSYTCLRRT